MTCVKSYKALLSLHKYNVLDYRKKDKNYFFVKGTNYYFIMQNTANVGKIRNGIFCSLDAV